MHAIADGTLVRTWPYPITLDKRLAVKCARQATSPLPPAPPSHAPHAQRRVPRDGVVMVARQRLADPGPAEHDILESEDAPATTRAMFARAFNGARRPSQPRLAGRRHTGNDDIDLPSPGRLGGHLYLTRRAKQGL
jgi:hypothetical protein